MGQQAGIAVSAIPPFQQERLLGYVDRTSTAGNRVVAVVEREDVGSPSNTRKFVHRDHQGSVTKITDASGSLVQSLAYDAWGMRRDASDWDGAPSGTPELSRGYTGHEHLDNVELIHMNGRVQDPLLGRFLSADPLIQAPFNTQSHNRYSYVWNNPASLIDPSGFEACENDSVTCWSGLTKDMRDSMLWHWQWVYESNGYPEDLNWRGKLTDGRFCSGGCGGGGYRRRAAGSTPVPDDVPNSNQFMGQPGVGGGVTAASQFSLPDIDTDTGLLAHVLMAEARGPASPLYNRGASVRSMWAMRAAYLNRYLYLRSGGPAYTFGTGSANISDIILAPGQTAGFGRDSNGQIVVNQDILDEINYTLRIANTGPPGRYAQHVQDVLTVAIRATSFTSLNYPIGNTGSIGGTQVMPSVYGFRTQGSTPPGGNFIAIPEAAGGVIGGQQFYTLPNPIP